MEKTKEQLIQEIMDTDMDERAIWVITAPRYFTCAFCGPKKQLKRAMSDPGLGVDLCGSHAQAVDMFREMGLSNDIIRTMYHPEMKK